LNAAAPRFNTELEQSMHKTFTDCYLAKGFIDGGWGYALNSNDADGEDLSVEENVLDEKDRRLAYYPLGWNSLEASDSLVIRSIKLTEMTGSPRICADRAI
jgi:hypothetical protein